MMQPQGTEPSELYGSGQKWEMPGQNRGSVVPVQQYWLAELVGSRSPV
jgi:hypothetical protein